MPSLESPQVLKDVQNRNYFPTIRKEANAKKQQDAAANRQKLEKEKAANQQAKQQAKEQAAEKKVKLNALPLSPLNTLNSPRHKRGLYLRV